MAAKKRTKKGSTSKRTANKKVTTTRRALKRRAAARTAKKKGAAKARKTLVIKPTAKKRTIRKGKREQTAVVDLIALESPSGLQSGDLQGMSNVERADSESVGELLEEGNASEAGTVMGVEQAEDEVGGEVRTHEVAKEGVPEEYLDKE